MGLRIQVFLLRLHVHNFESIPCSDQASVLNRIGFGVLGLH